MYFGGIFEEEIIVNCLQISKQTQGEKAETSSTFQCGLDVQSHKNSSGRKHRIIMYLLTVWQHETKINQTKIINLKMRLNTSIQHKYCLAFVILRSWPLQCYFSYQTPVDICNNTQQCANAERLLSVVMFIRSASRIP